jgi:hypothetical protein
MARLERSLKPRPGARTVRKALIVWFSVVVLVLLGLTLRASFDKSVLRAYVDLGSDPWGLATLFDAYFGFVAFFCWLAYRETRWGARALWFLALMALGNFAISAYALWRLAHWNPDTGAQGLLLRPGTPDAGGTA